MGKYSDLATTVFGFLGKMTKESPDLTSGFLKMHHTISENKALSGKQKELMALGIAIVLRCEGCIACHTKGAVDAGATKEEILETIEVAIVMGGGPSVVYSEKAYQAMTELI